MKTKVFWSQKKLLKYYEQNFERTKTNYTIIGRTKIFGIWERLSVLFYSQTDIKKKLEEIIESVLTKKINIKVNNFQCEFLNFKNYELDVDLFTSNNSLVVGKFGQNQKSLELLFSLTLSKAFRTRYKVNLNFPNYNKNFRHSSSSRYLKQKKPYKKNKTTDYKPKPFPVKTYKK